MKTNLLFAVWLGCLVAVQAATYHVDSSAGRDEADGLTPETALRTLERVNRLKLAPGDRVLFKRGGLWRGQLRPQSGEPGKPVFYGAYGDGAKPILQGSVDRSRPEDWVSVGDGVWATQKPRPPAVKEQFWDGTALKEAWGSSYQEGNRGRSWTETEDGVRFVRVTLEKKVRAAAHLLQLWGPKVANLPDAAVLRLRVRSTKPFPLPGGLKLSLNRPPWTPALTAVDASARTTIGREWSVVEVPLERRSDLAEAYLHFSIGDALPEGAVFDFIPLGLWRVDKDTETAIARDVGIFIVNHGEKWGTKKWDNPDWVVPPGSKWVKTVTKDKDLDFWHNPAEQRVYVRYPENPGAAFDSIELALTRHIVDEGGRHDVVYDGLHLRYGAAHGIGGGATANITVRNCDICWIGGGLQFWNKDPKTGRPTHPTRYGNGIEFWAGCGRNLVERNRLWQIYDAALTNQTKDSPAPETDIVWRDNIIWQAEYSFEYWNHDPTSYTANILFEHNTCVDAGGCWSHDQRPDPNGAHLMFYDNAAPTTNFVVRNNLFVGTTDRSTRFFNDWRVKHPAAHDGLVMTNNLYWIPANKIAEYHVNGRERREGRAGESVRLEAGSWGAGADEFRRYQEEFGLDAGSLYAEPQFVDAAQRDYRLKPGSPGTGLGARRADPRVSVLFEETFDNRPEGEAVYTEGNYNLHVKRDPCDPQNLMCWSGPYAHKTRGFGPGFQLPKPDLSVKDGAFVIESRFLFNFDASYFYRLCLMCTDNSSCIVWDVNADHLYGFKPARNKWYTLKRGYKIRENTTSLLVFDDTGKILYRELDRPIEDPNLHLSRGIKSGHSYIEPDLRVHEGFMAYDDLVVYTTTPENFDAQVAREIAASDANTPFFDTLAARAEKAPPVPNATARAEAFATRNTGEPARQVCRDLVLMLDLDRPEYAAVKSAVERGDAPGALKAFRTVFFGELRNLDEAYFDTSFRYRDLRTAATARIVDLKADALLHDLIPKSSTTFVACGKPGVINWAHDTVEKKFDGSFFFAQPYLWTYKTFDPLWRAYLATGDARYLRKWHEILDDYCLNQTMPFDLNAADLPDSMSDSAAVRDFLCVLKMIAEKLPSESDAVNEVSLARLVAKLLTYYPANLIVYMRSNPQNWSNGEYTDLALTGLAMSKLGFRAGEAVYRAGRQKMELYSTQANTLDGSDAEQVVAYDIVYSDGLHNFTRGLKRVAPERLSREDEDFIADNAILRATFLLHFTTPGGNYPMGFQAHLGSRLSDHDKFRAFVPQAFDHYENRALTELLRCQNGLAHEKGEVPPPTFTSEAFPYGGFYFFRDGWSKTGQNGFLYGHSHHVISNMGKNVFVLNAFGEDLLVAGNVGMYDHCVTQNFVDGQRQDFNAGIPYWGHRGPMVHANQEPLDARWGSSDLFDFGETFYAGAYLDDIKDVTHQRMVAFLKEQGVWIVTDRQSSPRAHTYTTRWTLPIEPTYGNGYRAFKPESIHVDAAAQTVRTQEPNKVNLSIYNFARTPVAYRLGGREVREGDGARISDFRFVDTDLAGASGDNILVSVFVPRKTINVDASNVQRLGLGEGVVGCTLTTPQGGTVKYAVAADRKQTFMLDGVTVTGEALVLSTLNGRTTGFVLGASALAVDGHACKLPRPDFQFVREGATVSMLHPIAKPLARVAVSPEATVFTGETAISLTCATPNTEIRYTTDLTSPTLASPLYTGPVTVTSNTVIKARAFRKGLTATPVVQSGTEMSAVIRADLRRETLRPAVRVPGKLEPGLSYQFFAGEWEKAFYGLDGVAACAAGVATDLFGVEPVRNPDGTYAVRYAGYFVAPEDGVYTFWAPEEYMSQNIVAGYELVVAVDGEAWRPTARRFARGAWSVALAKGAHAFRVDLVDFRADSVAWYNREGFQPIVWPGRVPALELSGPNFPRQPLPPRLLHRAE